MVQNGRTSWRTILVWNTECGTQNIVDSSYGHLTTTRRFYRQYTKNFGWSCLSRKI